MSDLQVVLLAAGMGTRLGRRHPKPLTVLRDGRSILRSQVDALRGALGSSVPITAVVGYRCEEVMAAAPDLGFVYNPDYASTNTSQSLLRALVQSRPGGVLWLNGDVVFDPRVLELLRPLLAGDESFVCVNTASVGEEEVKYTVDRRGLVRELSKTVRDGLGEAVGINYVTAADKAVLVDHLRRCREQDYFERGIETAVALDRLRVRPVDLGRLGAVEVDVEDDLLLANLVGLSADGAELAAP